MLKQLINKQIYCMRKLEVPENLIQKTIKKYSGSKLFIKLIECEEKHNSISYLYVK